MHEYACILCMNMPEHSGASVVSDSVSGNPMDFSLPGSSIHWILQARILESVAMSSSKGSS